MSEPVKKLLIVYPQSVEEQLVRHKKLFGGTRCGIIRVAIMDYLAKHGEYVEKHGEAIRTGGAGGALSEGGFDL